MNINVSKILKQENIVHNNNDNLISGVLYGVHPFPLFFVKLYIYLDIHFGVSSV